MAGQPSQLVCGWLVQSVSVWLVSLVSVWLVSPDSQCLAGQPSQSTGWLVIPVKSMGGWSVQSANGVAGHSSQVNGWLVSPVSVWLAGQSSQSLWLVEWQVPADAGVDAARHSLAAPTQNLHSC